MSTPEAEIKDYLKKRIASLGGDVRFFRWIGRNHAPDCFVMLPETPVTLVETKAPGKRPRPGQEREHERLRKYGVRVLVCPTKEDVDREFPID
jgi:hypothetical protein